MQTALRLVDTHGVEALSMRKLAAELGVNPMSLYHHVENKAALLDGLTRTLTEGARGIVVAGGTWRQQLYLLAHEFRALSRNHPGLMRYAFTRGTFAERDGPMGQSLRAILISAGLPSEEAGRIGAVLAALVGGLLLSEVNAAFADDEGFATAVWLLIDGVAARV